MHRPETSAKIILKKKKGPFITNVSKQTQTSYWLLSIVMVLFVGICAERFQTDYRLSFPQDARTEAALKGEPPGSSEEQYFEETSLRDVSSEIFRQANRRTSSRTTDFLRFFYCLAALLLPFLPVTGIISWTFRKYVVPSRDTIIQYIHHKDGKKSFSVFMNQTYQSL